MDQTLLKIIFLDIDGVLTTGPNYLLHIDKFNMIADICQQTGAKIVLSSSWRNFTFENTIKELNELPSGNLFKLITPYFIGITPRFQYCANRWYNICDFITCVKANAHPELYDSESFKNYDKFKCVIVDDCDILGLNNTGMEFLQITTDAMSGLSDDNKTEILEYFNS